MPRARVKAIVTAKDKLRRPRPRRQRHVRLHRATGVEVSSAARRRFGRPPGCWRRAGLMHLSTSDFVQTRTRRARQSEPVLCGDPSVNSPRSIGSATQRDHGRPRDARESRRVGPRARGDFCRTCSMADSRARAARVVLWLPILRAAPWRAGRVRDDLSDRACRSCRARRPYSVAGWHRRRASRTTRRAAAFDPHPIAPATSSSSATGKSLIGPGRPIAICRRSMRRFDPHSGRAEQEVPLLANRQVAGGSQPRHNYDAFDVGLNGSA